MARTKSFWNLPSVKEALADPKRRAKIEAGTKRLAEATRRRIAKENKGVRCNSCMHCETNKGSCYDWYMFKALPYINRKYHKQRVTNCKNYKPAKATGERRIQAWAVVGKKGNRILRGEISSRLFIYLEKDRAKSVIKGLEYYFKIVSCEIVIKGGE